MAIALGGTMFPPPLFSSGSAIVDVQSNMLLFTWLDPTTAILGMSLY